ncbi:MAG: PQQ-dependent sugar dehydrogenase, partial [Vicinamibacterales bacterium]
MRSIQRNRVYARALRATTCALSVGFLLSTAAVREAHADPIPSPWVARDIGAPAIAGDSSFDPTHKAFTITGAGADIWGAADQFHFVY